jgi:hypothetical protein
LKEYHFKSRVPDDDSRKSNADKQVSNGRKEKEGQRRKYSKQETHQIHLGCKNCSLPNLQLSELTISTDTGALRAIDRACATLATPIRQRPTAASSGHKKYQ